jgi:hypothetical protein
MDWDQIVGRNRERLLAVLAPLLAVLGFDPRRRQEMPRHFYRSWLILLRPAESAVRRLIVMAARGIAVKLGAARGFPAGLALKLAAKAADEERISAFGLIDPLKRFAPADFEWSKEWSEDWGREQIIPRISVPGLFDPLFPEPTPVPSRDDPIDTAALLRRIAALKAALDNLPRQARRLARWKVKRELARQAAVRKPGRMSPMRPGFAPGYHRSDRREIDEILADCHHFAYEAWVWTRLEGLAVLADICRHGVRAGPALARLCVTACAIFCTAAPSPYPLPEGRGGAPLVPN